MAANQIKNRNPLAKYFQSNGALFKTVAFVAVFGVAGIFALTRSSAVSPSLYFSPSTSSVHVGDTVSVAVRLDPGSASDGVEAIIKYNPALLSYVSIDATGSAFPTQIVLSNTAGQLQIDRGIFAPGTVSADALVATVTFKALAVASPATLQLSGNATYSGNYLNPAPTNAAITISAATPPPSDTQPPVVTITKPTNGSSSSRKFDISASATDNKAIGKMELFIDGVISQTTTTSQISYTWSVKSRTVAKGAHTIRVSATDTAGNVASKSVTVYK